MIPSPARTLASASGNSASVPPLPEDKLTERALISVAELLRRYHQAVASFDPAGYGWPRPVPARFAGPLVSHNEVHPANVIFRGGRAVALIDFDLAGPGSPARDLAAAARHWTPLYDEELRHHHRRGAGWPSGVHRLLAASGGPDDPGPPLVRGPPRRPAGRRRLTAPTGKRDHDFGANLVAPKS